MKSILGLAALLTAMMLGVFAAQAIINIDPYTPTYNDPTNPDEPTYGPTPPPDPTVTPAPTPEPIPEPEPCYTKEEAQARADANVAAYSKCAKDGDEICTQDYRAAEDQWKIDYAACSDKPTAQECQACKDEADSVKMAALDVYNNCISTTEGRCMDSANADYPPLEPICPD